MLKRPVLLCFDGSDDAAHAIAKAGEMLGIEDAAVLSVWELVEVWQPYTRRRSSRLLCRGSRRTLSGLMRSRGTAPLRE